MKELSIEEKAKRYDDALTKARNIVNSINVGLIGKDSFEAVFPELAESDDERVRKGLIELVKQSSEILEKKNQEQMIDWLEKQGEQKLAGNVEPKFKKGDRVIGIISGMQYYITEVCNDYYYTESGCIIMFCAQDNFELVEQQLKEIEQKPTDEEMKEFLQTEYEKGRADAIAEMQKSWSEEDEKQLNDIMWIIEAYRKNGFNETHIQIADNSENWLKFLKDRVQPQSQWKPSEEQMVAINTAINVLGKGTLNGKQLIELQEALKKLKG